MVKAPCVIKKLSPAQADVAADRLAERIRSGRYGQEDHLTTSGLSTHIRNKLAVVKDNKWPGTSVHLKVAFVDHPEPPAALRDHIISIMNEWSNYCDVSFTAGGWDSEVRISLHGDGYWSFLGTDILGYSDPNTKTMCLDGFTVYDIGDPELRGTVLHETGHTLGFEHEHLRPEIVQWIDPKKAEDFYEESDNWLAEETRAQVLTPLNNREILASAAYDLHSIMCYPIERKILKSYAPDVTGGNVISPVDIQFASSLYPKGPSVSYDVIDHNTGVADLVAANGDGRDLLYKCHRDGGIWLYTAAGRWEKIDNNGLTVELLARKNRIYQRHSNGQIWMRRSSGVWKRLDGNPQCHQLAKTDHTLYQLHRNGQVWEYTNHREDWKMIDNNPITVHIVTTADELFLRHSNGQIWRYDNFPCDWIRVDAKPSCREIVTTDSRLYQRHQNGQIWMYTGYHENWTMILGNSNTIKLFTDTRRLYRQESNGDIYVNQYNSLDNWVNLHLNKHARKVVVTDHKIYLLTRDGRILQYRAP